MRSSLRLRVSAVNKAFFTDARLSLDSPLNTTLGEFSR